MFIIGYRVDHEGVGSPILIPITRKSRRVELDPNTIKELYAEVNRGLDVYVVADYASRSGLHEVKFGFQPVLRLGRVDIYCFRKLCSYHSHKPLELTQILDRAFV